MIRLGCKKLFQSRRAFTESKIDKSGDWPWNELAKADGEGEVGYLLANFTKIHSEDVYQRTFGFGFGFAFVFVFPIS